MNISAILKLCDLELGSFLYLSDPVSELERSTDLRERETRNHWLTAPSTCGVDVESCQAASDPFILAGHEPDAVLSLKRHGTPRPGGPGGSQTSAGLECNFWVSVALSCLYVESSPPPFLPFVPTWVASG